MIARLSGKLVEKQPPHLLVDVQGVGYEVLAPMTTFYALPELGANVVLHTHFSVTETSQQLFGFYDKSDRALFRLLIKVNGVGPKMGLAILSGMTTQEVVNCMMEGNVAALVRVPGVGKKTAERLLIEMKDRLKDWDSSSSTATVSVQDALPVVTASASIADAESALMALGYKSAEAAKAIARVTKDSNAASSEEIIRLALKSMVPAA